MLTENGETEKLSFCFMFCVLTILLPPPPLLNARRLGQAKVEREGSDVTIATFSKMVGFALEAAEKAKAEHGIDVEVCFLC